MSSKNKKPVFSNKLSKENSINDHNNKIIKKVNEHLQIQDKKEKIQVTNSTKTDKNASKL